MEKSNVSKAGLVFKEKNKTLLAQSSINVLTHLVAGTIAAFLLANFQPNHGQWVWLIVLWLDAVRQSLNIRKIKRKGFGQDGGQDFLRACIISCLVMGLQWAAFVVLFINFDIGSYSAWAMSAIVCGLSAASFTSTTLHLPLYFLFSTPPFVTFVVLLMASGERDFFIMAGLIVTFYIMCINIAKVLHNKMTESFNLRFENIAALKALSEQKELAEQANIAKSKFIAAASHDLRQPMHALGFFIDALKTPDKEDSHLFQKIDASITNLNVLFDSLLDISNLDAGTVKINKTHFSLSTLFLKLNDTYSVEATNKDISLNFEKSADVVYTDINLLLRILGNLLSNAIRYTNKGSVTVNVERNSNDLISVNVVDTGIGISTSDLNIIFDEYQQLNNPERDRRKGLGLGLSIVKRLCDLLEHEITFTSQLNQGSTFNVSLPIGQPEQVIKQEPVNIYQDRDLSGKRILIIDDEIDIREAMTSVLNRWGCKTLCCESGADALIRVAKQRFDFNLVISDMRLRNGENGIVVINSILEQFKRHNTPALLITGDTAPERILEANASGYPLLHKPLRPAVLRLHLVKIFEQVQE